MSLRKSAMAVFIEPAPYIVRLLEELQLRWSGTVQGWFVDAALTQNWVLEEESERYRILPSAMPRAIAVLCREMVRTRPAVVFVAGWSHPIVIVAIIMARIMGAQVVSMSDTWTSKSSGLRARLKRVVLSLIHVFTPGGTRPARYLIDQGVPKARIFPAGMTSDIRAIRAFMAIEGSASRLIRRKAMKVPETAVIFLYVGRLESVKGPDLLVDAFSSGQLNQKTRLVIVGDGALHEKVSAVAADDPRILMRGRLEGPALWTEFAAADILIVPSREEPWGLVINEAMGAGLAVLVNDCCGCIDDLVHDGLTGIIVPTGDQVALRSNLIDLSYDPERVAILRGNARTHIEGWSTEAWADKIIIAWQEALDIGSRGSRKKARYT